MLVRFLRGSKACCTSVKTRVQNPRACSSINCVFLELGGRERQDSLGAPGPASLVYTQVSWRDPVSNKEKVEVQCLRLSCDTLVCAIADKHPPIHVHRRRSIHPHTHTLPSWENKTWLCFCL